MLQYLSYNRYIYKCGKFSCRVVNCHNSTTKVSHGSAWVEIKVSLHFNCPYGSPEKKNTVFIHMKGIKIAYTHHKDS